MNELTLFATSPSRGIYAITFNREWIEKDALPDLHSGWMSGALSSRLKRCVMLYKRHGCSLYEAQAIVDYWYAINGG